MDCPDNVQVCEWNVKYLSRVCRLQGVESDPPSAGHLRIGELSRRVGVSTELLRAWERRYGLLSPARTSGGFRLYGDGDERRVRRMLEHMESGVSAAEGARLALLERDEAPVAETGEGPVPGAIGEHLRQALDRFDEPGAHAALDRLLSAFALETVLRDAVLPYLQELGERWQRGEASIGQEHFASALLRGRLLGLARGWGSGGTPLALLACLPGDQHDLGLICFGLTLHGHGWRITFLGPDTPLATITETARLLSPALVVLTATTAAQTRAAESGLAEVARSAPLALAGAGASAAIAESVGARYLEGDPVSAATRVTASAA
jgi:MerR family transcriptional regulator, light-induced transcriptional regulator